jgi:hypothetical protein
MKIGLMMPFNQVTVGPGAFAQKAEEFGFESLWVPEHAVIPARDRRFMAREGVADAYELMGDLFVALGMAASVTKRIKLATGICVLTDRNPLLTAKEAATLDLFSDGRLLMGVGVGSLHDATAIMGIDTRRPWVRIADYVGAMRRLWTSDISSYEGEFVSFEDVLSYPKPRQPNGPPVVHRRFDDRASPFRRSHRRGNRDGFASGRSDLSRHLLRGTGIEAFPLQAAPGVIDNDSCSPRREEQGIGASQPSARARYYGYTMVESQFWQWALLWLDYSRVREKGSEPPAIATFL